jgi:hypothetical protein
MSDKHYFECQCSYVNHLVCVDCFDDEIFIYVQLKRSGFFQRFWNGLKYIFGKSVSWEETILDKEQIKRLKLICDKVLKDG